MCLLCAVVYDHVSCLREMKPACPELPLAWVFLLALLAADENREYGAQKAVRAPYILYRLKISHYHLDVFPSLVHLSRNLSIS